MKVDPMACDRSPSPHSIPRSRPSSSHAHRPPEPAAIVFDLDGTLVDTVGTRIGAWLEVFERYRLPATHEQLAALIGIDGRRLAREVAVAAGLPIDDELCEDIDQVFYLVGDVDLQGRRAAVQEWLGSNKPCMTLLFVSALAAPEYRVEIDAWACDGGGRSPV